MADAGAPLLDVQGLDVHFGSGAARKHVIKEASLRVEAGESVGVIGETGSGKSTIARAVLGLVKPSSGVVRIEGTDVTGFDSRRWRGFRRRGAVQYVFQDPLRSLDPDLTVGASIAEPLRLRGGLSSAEISSRVDEHLSRMKLDADFANRFPAELSGGQRQRVAVARALVTEPELLILDEPVSALDSANRVQVLHLLEELRRSDVALVFISHDLGSVAGITDRTIVLYRGTIVEDAPTEQIINRPTHPYTRLLIGSAPTLRGAAIDRSERDELRAALARHTVG
ncbi:ABC transporter ATP-binding protein [Microbacterium betulae]|uniref:ABC transporter ATP-binding protein n=1 Tax=Microbacterium betulae TaxID=2981139 RepID=A0AA97I598_9MICO|nr:ABC transporter ATP-binding protein [Microbacterium sp. AB]WOF23491.1 ABC transporter ATP-binding protein [Microbacterium sp. AB]